MTTDTIACDLLPVQIRAARPDGSVVTAIGSAQPLRDPQGSKIGAVLTVREEAPRPHA